MIPSYSHHRHFTTATSPQLQPHQIVQVLLAAVASIVLAQSPHENHGDQPHQKYHHHEGVEDGEPVDLEVAEVAVVVMVVVRNIIFYII